MGRPALPAHGTIKRYRLELKSKTVCEKCRAANSREKAKERANRRARDQRARLSIVPDPQDEPTSPTPSTDDAPAEPGEMEKAVSADLAEIPEGERVAFHRSYSALALQLAREVDTATAASARSTASRALFEVLKALRSRKEGGDGQSALDLFLDDFGLPLVPDGPA